MTDHIVKPMTVDELVVHLRGELKKHPSSHRSFCDSYGLGTRDTYCLIRHAGLVFSLKADTKYEAIKIFIAAIEKNRSPNEAVVVDDIKSKSPKLRIVGYDSASGWYCYYRRQDEQMQVLIDAAIDKVKSENKQKKRDKQRFKKAG